jgi:hypothetical protein
LISEQISPHEELLDAVHEAAVQYVEADRELENYRLVVHNFTPESEARLRELRRNVVQRSEALRAAQTQLLLSNPAE